MKAKPTKTPTRPARKPSARQGARRCGLCGKTGSLTRTECCKRWVCGHQMRDGRPYAPSRCYQKHDRFTLCASHWAEEHDGRWQDCEACRREFPIEMYVYYGTNKYNFETLENPPAFEPTHCAKCGVVISLSRDGHTRSGGEYWCVACSDAEFARRQAESSTHRRPNERGPTRQ